MIGADRNTYQKQDRCEHEGGKRPADDLPSHKLRDLRRCGTRPHQRQTVSGLDSYHGEIFHWFPTSLPVVEPRATRGIGLPRSLARFAVKVAEQEWFGRLKCQSSLR